MGGLTVFKAIRARLSAKEMVYLGDTARLPYGTKSADTVTRCALQAPRWLLIIPVLWSAIGGSAAILFKVPRDYGLIATLVISLVFLIVNRHRYQARDQIAR